jgi:hypothetical protein
VEDLVIEINLIGRQLSDREIVRRAKRRGEGCPAIDVAQCLYCAMPIAFSHEHDHFPVPFDLGGSEVHCVCKNCHDLKDRGGLVHLPDEIVDEALRAFHARATASEQRCLDLLLAMLAESARTFPIELVRRETLAEWRRRWPTWAAATGIERVALASLWVAIARRSAGATS